MCVGVWACVWAHGVLLANFLSFESKPGFKTWSPLWKKAWLTTGPSSGQVRSIGSVTT